MRRKSLKKNFTFFLPGINNLSTFAAALRDKRKQKRHVRRHIELTAVLTEMLKQRIKSKIIERLNNEPIETDSNNNTI